MKGKMIRSVLKEYGAKWAVNRSLYSAKLKMLCTAEGTEKIFEKKVNYPSRLDLFNVDTEKIKAFLQEFPEEKKKELERLADNACEGKILGFSSLELDYGYPLDWQLNPLTGKKCNAGDKWYRIPDFDSQRGDIKTVWEASRFSHFVTLARAYLLTKNEKYYRAFSEQLNDWIKNNSYGFGANFKCGQECALRLVNALLAYTVFFAEGTAQERDKENTEILVMRCYRKILSNFFYARKCIKNNHTISELMGMIVGAWCCTDEKNLSLAFRMLDDTIDEQFTEDGGYTQYSFNYERLALQDIEVVLCIEKKTGHRLQENSRRKILAAAELMYQCQDDTGDMPNYGANDGALAFPVTSCGYRDFRPVVYTTYALLTGRKLYGTGFYEEERFWFGEGGIGNAEQKDRVSNAFGYAGIYTFRRADSWAMTVLNDYKSRPAHMDQLHFDLWVDGVNVFCDRGTYSYASEEGKELAGNKGHNTAVCEGRPQMNTHGVFLVYDWTRKGRVKHTNSLFYGEMTSINGYSHHRSIEVTKTGYRITDRLGGNGKYKILFHTPCEIRHIGRALELWIGKKALCAIRSTAEPEVCGAYRSLHYLEKEEINCIVFSAGINDTVITDIEILR